MEMFNIAQQVNMISQIVDKILQNEKVIDKDIREAGQLSKENKELRKELKKLKA